MWVRANYEVLKACECGMDMRLNGKQLEAVDCFKYLGSKLIAIGWCEMDVVHRTNEEYIIIIIKKGW